MNSKIKKFCIIDDSVEEAIRGASFLAKVKGMDPEVEEHFKNAIQKDPNNLEKICAYCFYFWFQVDEHLDVNDTNTLFKVSIHVVDTIDELLYEHPEYWILQVLKYRIRSFMNFEDEEQIKQIEYLIDIQNDGNYPSYFLVMDILLSFSYFNIGDYDKAYITLKNIPSRYKGKITVLKEFFYQYIEEYKNILIRSPEDRIIKILDEISKGYF